MCLTSNEMLKLDVAKDCRSGHLSDRWPWHAKRGSVAYRSWSVVRRSMRMRLRRGPGRSFVAVANDTPMTRVDAELRDADAPPSGPH
ncbi:hypothetical protein EVAR_18939_1 [Eumeta japonica]|uniref:Uncharacterized protein n=1 Tax=Eumeta variegata TaxID=151549 RepID=A0A4C1V369_EUMVA|nr:hypothetical protein EVAR_18939_1 [Eumeta japonica]